MRYLDGKQYVPVGNTRSASGLVLGRTTVAVHPLTPEQRIAEVARMIGGTNVTETVLQHAREMLSYTAAK